MLKELSTSQGQQQEQQQQQRQQRTVLPAMHRYQRMPSSAANVVGRNN
jgi:hypothetical protein